MQPEANSSHHANLHRRRHTHLPDSGTHARHPSYELHDLDTSVPSKVGVSSSSSSLVVPSSSRPYLYHLRVPSFSLTVGGSDLLHALDEPPTYSQLDDTMGDHVASRTSHSAATSSVASSAISTPKRELHPTAADDSDSYGMHVAATTSAASASSSARSSFNNADGKSLLSHLGAEHQHQRRPSPARKTPQSNRPSPMNASQSSRSKSTGPDVDGHVILQCGEISFVLILRSSTRSKTGKAYAKSTSPAPTNVVHGYLCMREVQSKLLDALPQYRGRTEQSSRSSIRQELEKVRIAIRMTSMQISCRWMGIRC